MLLNPQLSNISVRVSEISQNSEQAFVFGKLFFILEERKTTFSPLDVTILPFPAFSSDKCRQ